MALSADRRIEYKEGVEVPFKMGAGARIYAGANAAVNAAGYLVAGADTAGLIFAGVAREAKDNGAGQNGDADALVLRRGLVRMSFGNNISIANVGDNVFLVDDDKVDLAANVTNLIFCGVIAGYIDATHAWVDIEPAIKQADVATHIANASGAHAASAVSLTDAGAHFAAAESQVEAALQKLAKTVTISLPRFTGWTKDGAAHTIALPGFELPVPVRVKRAYVNLGTAPTAAHTLALALNGSALASVADANTQGENEALDIAIAANTDFAFTATETAGGTGANCDIMLVASVDDGE